MPRRAALAQVLGVSPWRRGGRPVPLGTDAGRAATAAPARGPPASENEKKGRRDGRLHVRASARTLRIARPACLRAPRACTLRASARPACPSAPRACTLRAPARTFTWRASRASHLAHSVRTDATHCVRPDASCCVRSVYKVGQFRAQSQVISRISWRES